MGADRLLLCPRCMTEDALIVKTEGGEYVLEYFADGDSVLANQVYDQPGGWNFFSHMSPRTSVWAECRVCGLDPDTRQGVCCVTGCVLVLGVPHARLANRGTYEAWLTEQHDAGRRRVYPGERWRVVEECVGRWGFDNAKRDEELDDAYGRGNWRVEHTFCGRVIARSEAIALYEAAYFRFLQHNQELVDWLCSETDNECSDWSTDDTECSLSYEPGVEDEAPLQDIAVRRVVVALNRILHGEFLAKVRERDPTAYPLNPGKVPFHLPTLICEPELAASPDNPRIGWDKGSIASFWHNNQVLLVR